MTDAQRRLAYAEAQVNHPDPQLRPLLAWMFGPGLPRLRSAVEREQAEGGHRPQVDH